MKYTTKETFYGSLHNTKAHGKRLHFVKRKFTSGNVNTSEVLFPSSAGKTREVAIDVKIRKTRA